MKPPQGSSSTSVLTSAVTNLSFSAWGKGRLYNEFYITIRIHHSSTQFPSQTSAHYLRPSDQVGFRNPSYMSFTNLSPDPKYMGVDF